MAEFAQQNGFEIQRLQRWQLRLRDRATQAARPIFEEVVLPSLPSVLEVVLRTGHVIRVGAAFDPEAVCRLADALEEGRC